LTMAVYALGVGLYVWNSRPYVSLQFDINWPDQPPALSASDCGSNDGHERESRTTNSGRSVSILLCFKAQQTKKGDFAIPTKLDGDAWWGGHKYSPEIGEYMKRVAAEFQLSKLADTQAEEQWAAKRKEDLRTGALFLFGGVVALWAVGLAIGWIARGFAGIPMGKDFRDDA